MNMNTNNTKPQLRNYNSDDDGLSRIGIIVLTLLSVLVTLFLIFNEDILTYEDFNECSESGVASIANIVEGEPYMVAPYLGGRVTEYTPTLFQYTYNVDGKDYYIAWKSDLAKGKEVPESLDIRYNPENPEEVIVNQAPFYPAMNMGEDIWIYYRRLEKSDEN